MKYFAHSSNKKGSPWEPLSEHLQLVATRAKSFASAFNAGEEAYIAGWLHDLGKYSELFLKRLRNKASRLDHWSAGAIAVLLKYRAQAFGAAMAILGHHIGLQCCSVGTESFKALFDIAQLKEQRQHPLGLQLTDSDINAMMQRLIEDGLPPLIPPCVSHYDHQALIAAAMLDARMLFSTLVDADYIETEAHFEGEADGSKVYRLEGPKLDASHSLEILHQHIEYLRTKTKASDDVRIMRADLIAACKQKAEWPQNLFTLTAPTGAGKTLAMLEFALRHAQAHPSIRRIVFIIPFLSIIDQTARTYRQLFESDFGPHYVLEHHSLAGVTKKDLKREANPDNEDEVLRTAGLLAENWDAPIVITTSVQLFESLFSNRPSNCRKLHRLANSIVLFDEVQTLPPGIAVPSLAALSHLAQRYGCTVVFSTATQPAFEHLHNRVAEQAPTGWRPCPIVDRPYELFGHARRVKVEWQIEESRPWEAIAEDLAKKETQQILCVVNLKRHARRLALLLKEESDKDGLFHLSTSMCPAHRERVLSEVRERLASQEIRPCRLIATQCIEAGVDVDFPVAYRAFGPLDAIAQVAGRCNREGKLDGQGRMVVFLPEKEIDKEHLYPPGGYKEATETTLTLIRLKEAEAHVKGVPVQELLDIYNPELFEQYYRLLYDLTGAINLNCELADALARRSFIDVAEHYHLIDQETISVVVPYAEEMELFEDLKNTLRSSGRLTREWIQQARPLTISLYRPKDGDIVWNFLGSVPLARGQVADDWFIYLNRKDYDNLLGLQPPNEIDAWNI